MIGRRRTIRARTGRIVPGVVVLGLVAGPGPVAGQDARILGIVHAAGDTAVLANALVTLNLGRTTLTDTQGRFEFGEVEFGTNLLAIRRLGYELLELVVHVPRDTTLALRFGLSALPVRLDDLEVTADGSQPVPHLVRNGFYERKGLGEGRFLERADIERLSPSYPSRLLERFPSRYRRPCVLYLDGVRLNPDPMSGRTLLQELNEVVAVDQIVAMEIYSGVADAPARFNSVRGPRCASPAILVVWTR